MGRKSYLIWLYILGVLLLACIVCISREGFQDATYYTIHSRTYDGFGTQYHAIMSGIAYSKPRGYVYVHTPFREMSHGGDVSALNEFIGIQTSSMAKDLKAVKTEEFSREVHESERPSKYYTPEVIQILRDYYYSTEKPTISENDIAVHIRRGDVAPNANTWGDRYTSNNDYKKILAMLRREYPSYTISIHSEGTQDEFSDLLGKNITCNLNEDVRQTFHSLVTAKVLVMAKSSLSYSAAILNEGTVYYQDFWHKPLDGWKNVLR